MPKTPTTTVKVTPEEVLPVFGEIFSRPLLKAELSQIGREGAKRTLYWRLFTPLIVLWCLIVQRLSADHSCDGVVSHLHTGAADGLDGDDPHPQPLSQRMRSESTAAYVQARERLPLALVRWAFKQVWRVVCGWLSSSNDQSWRWQGHGVRLLDGTTFRLPFSPELSAAYGQAENGLGKSYWIVVRSVITFCLHTHLAVAVSTADMHTSESAMLYPLMVDDEAGVIYIGDINFGVYRTVQTAHAFGQHVLLRLRPDRFEALRRTLEQPAPLRSGQEWNVFWSPGPQIRTDPRLPAVAIAGRLLYLHLDTPGFRPLKLYFFTTLCDRMRYSFEALCQLYALRWQAELDYRHIKTTLDMEEFTARSPAIFQLELMAGILTYNLIRTMMVKAALFAHCSPVQLSFQQSFRRLRDALFSGVPAWVAQSGQILDHLLARLAKCRLPFQPNKVRHEPRRVRRRPQVYPALQGDRSSARQQNLLDLGFSSPTTDLLSLSLNAFSLQFLLLSNS